MSGRRRFLQAGLGSGLGLALPGCRRLQHLGIPIQVLYPGMAEGHALRDSAPLPAPGREIRCHTAILGSGVAGLTAAWRLAAAGRDDFLLLSGPEAHGNAAGGVMDGIAHPRGAHYLPLPSLESTPVRTLLAELGVIEAEPYARRPRYSESALVHAPDERLYLAGSWHDGLLPTAQLSPAEAAQQRAFLAHMLELGQRRGHDGRRAFAVPLVLSSADPAWRKLDEQPFRDWLNAAGFDAPSLLAYLDYVCRDEYGARLEQISAWRGLHYFASRGGQAANAPDGSLLTWPDGLAFLARGLRARVPPPCQLDAHALSVEERADGVDILASGPAGPFRIHARKAICATPLHVAARLMPGVLRRRGFDPAVHLPVHAPWLVANLLLDGFPPEPPDQPLAWDNVVHGSPALGWVVATHQLIRAARPAQTVFTTYRALADATPTDARRILAGATAAELFELATADLRQVYGELEVWKRVRAAEITVRAHGMASPRIGSLANPGLTALQESAGPVLFAHSDLSGYSVFEEAMWWGEQAALNVLAQAG